MSGNPFMILSRHGIDIIDPMNTRIRKKTEFEPFVWLGVGHYEINAMGSFSYIGENANLLGVNSIGRYCSIARNVIMGESEHPTDFLSSSPIFYSKSYWRDMSFLNDYYKNCGQDIIEASADLRKKHQNLQEIDIGHDVWIGENVFIRKGVKIGNGAIIASRSVVIKDVPDYQIVGGTPAKLIRYRFESKIIERLNKIKWWEYDIRGFSGVKFNDIEQALSKLEDLIENKQLNLYQPKRIIWGDL